MSNAAPAQDENGFTEEQAKSCLVAVGFSAVLEHRAIFMVR
jgi:hypothetical protein